MNAGMLVDGAAHLGWDAIVPGTDFDYDSRPGEPESVLLLGRLGGKPIEPLAIRANGEPAAVQSPVAEFLFATPGADWIDPSMFNEVRFRCDPDEEPSFTTFEVDLVLPGASWGPPDFRETTHGWMSWLGEDFVMSWTEPGNDFQGTRTLRVHQGNDDTSAQWFWVRAARAFIYLHGTAVTVRGAASS